MNTIDIQNITTERLKSLTTLSKQVTVDVLRLDKIHPVISGNKWFKLKYYLQNARLKGCDRIVTFGGAYSNHIAATAYAAKLHGFQSTGLIRGEEPQVWSHTLQAARSSGMLLQFLSRTDYNRYKRNISAYTNPGNVGKAYVVPEGGFGQPGVKGASEILETTDISKYSHIIAAVGTGTTIAGLIHKTTDSQQILGISSMKNNNSLSTEIELLLNRSLPGRFYLVNEYHFGGYARYTDTLIEWMNNFYREHRIPLDFVYTGKMMYGIFDMISKDLFPAGSGILAVHSGGLQGNGSLAPGVLKYFE
ncbi:MAG: pyridoxal-phosphate dependent enzyme [Chitinophagaceae bacterium]|nr:pyridoxal-phosphate dependent enzyme [Chitinophagaceae bacterium]